MRRDDASLVSMVLHMEYKLPVLCTLDMYAMAT